MALVLDKSLFGQIWRFGLVGVAGFVVNAGLVEMLVKSVGPVGAQIVAFPAAATLTWWLNRSYTFGASGHAAHFEWLRYILANSLGWLANNGTYLAMVFCIPFAYERPSVAVAAGSLSGMFFNFAASKLLVFKAR